MARSVYFHWIVLLTYIAVTGCSKKMSPAVPVISCIYNGVDTCNKQLKLTINLSSEKQVIHSFGASDCWTTKFVGRWNDEAKRSQIADWLFSTDTTAAGKPKGIGLSRWRFNIGAGSFEQGDTSDIHDDYRREECFLTKDGTYDWSKHTGQRWFAQAAKNRGVKYLLGFSVSAPVSLTRNGKAFSPEGTSYNLLNGKMPAYADFLTTVCDHFNQAGLPFDYLSPFNEPQWGWTAGANGKASQEGSPASNTDIANLVREVGPKLQAKKLVTKILVGEAGQLDFLYSRNNDDRGEQISNWFNPSSANFIGNVPNIASVISYHSYFSTCPDPTLVSTRQSADSNRMAIPGSLQLWQSEFGILGNICNQYSGSPRNTGIDYGLYVAKVIHHDLAIANVSSWQWWLAVNPYDYSDGLVYINALNGAKDPQQSKTDGLISDSKQLWCLGNYSRFVRPGMVRIEAGLPGTNDPAYAARSLMISAYKSVADKQLVIVIVNLLNESKLLALEKSGTPGLSLKDNKFVAYTTSATQNLDKFIIAADNIVLEPKSITTLVGNYQ